MRQSEGFISSSVQPHVQPTPRGSAYTLLLGQPWVEVSPQLNTHTFLFNANILLILSRPGRHISSSLATSCCDRLVVGGRAGVNYTRSNYNYNCNYLATVNYNYNYNYSSLSPITVTNTITFYQLQLQLLWDGKARKLRNGKFNIFFYLYSCSWISCLYSSILEAT